MMVLLAQLLYVGLAIKSILYKDHILSFLRVAGLTTLQDMLPLVLLSLSSTRLKASGARASPAFTSNDRFIRIVPELAFLACNTQRMNNC